MAKNQKDKGTGLTFGDILISVLIALAVGIAAFLVILVGGSLLAPDFGKSQTADQPPTVSQPMRGTLPSSAPTSTPTPESTEPPVEPSDEPEPGQTVEPEQQTAEPTAAPSQAPAPAQTQAPATTPTSAPAQNPGPIVSINPTAPPASQTQAPVQSGGSGGGNSSTYDRSNWPAGKFLGSVESDKYHSHNCRAAATILPENEIWFDSESAARAANYSRCGICW